MERNGTKFLRTFRSEEIDNMWPQVEPFIQRVIHKAGLYYTADWIKSALERCEMQLWVQYWNEITSVCVTQIVTHPVKTLEIVLVAGEMDCLNNLQDVEDWGRKKGCKVIRLIGRKGWGKVLNDYKQTQITLEKEL